MKLLRLKLNSPFRSLSPGFEINFLREWKNNEAHQFNPYCLVGKNGSGKSNVLEALAAIFYHIECIYLDPDSRPEGFMTEDPENLDLPGFNPRSCTPDAFELDYLFSISDFLELVPESKSTNKQVIYKVRISKPHKKRPTIQVSAQQGHEFSNEIELTGNRVKKLLPAYVVSYSSGQNEVLSLPFLKTRFIAFDAYCDKLRRKITSTERPETRMIYLDDQYSQVILLCHYLFPVDSVTEVFQKKVDLKGFRRFRLIIRRFKRIELEPDSASATSNKGSDPESVDLTENISKLINKLVSCSTTQYEEPREDEGEDAVDLYLDFYIDGSTREAFAHHFRDESGGTDEEQKAASALNIFHAFQTLLILNSYKSDDATKRELYESASLYANETIPNPASHERIARFKESQLIKTGTDERIYLKNLSDGEHQLLHTVGLCLLFRHKPTLFLLDEPETHLNPSWRASFVSTLRTALETEVNAKETMREVLLTSHSPFIVSDCQQENVLVFKKSENNEVTCERPDIETFGTSANIITSKIFEQGDTIGEFARSQLDNLELRLQKGEDGDDLIDEAHNLLGDSVEKILFVNRVLEKKGKS